jgi:hypothetical protein
MEQYHTTGRFPPLVSSGAGNGGALADSTKAASAGYIETEVRNRFSGEVLKVFTVHGIILLIINIIRKAWARIALLGP